MASTPFPATPVLLPGDELTGPNVRRFLVDWMERTGWTCANIIRAMRVGGFHDVVSADRLYSFVRKADLPLNRKNMRALMTFLGRNPDPGCPMDFIGNLHQTARYMVATEEQEILARRQRVEDDRRRHRETWLAREHQPKRRERSEFFGFDRATVAALSGGTL